MAYIEFVVAGTAFEERPLLVEMLHLGDELFLERDPHNPSDVNAIRLRTSTGDILGYVPRYIATDLAFLLDRTAEAAGVVDMRARIFELLHEPVTGDSRVSVTVDLPDEWVIHLRSVAQENYAAVRTYVIEQTARASYIMMRCSADQMLTARSVLIGNGFAVDRSGFASRPASNGQRYAWFIRVSTLSPQRYAEVHLALRRAGFTCEDDILLREQQRVEQMRQAQEALWQARRIEQEAKMRIQQCDEKISEKEREIKELRFQLDQLKPSSPAPVVEKPHADPVWMERLFDSIADALKPEQILDAIEGQFPHRVAVLAAARQSARAAEKFRHRRRLANVLLKLVTEYWTELQMGHGDADARRVLGDYYAAQESETVANTPRLRRARTFAYEGRSLYMSQHLKIGVKDGVSETIRVHFAWDEPTRMIVIGHCGEHLPIR